MEARYRELLVEGPRGWTLGFIQGFLRALGNDGTLFDAEEEGIDCEPFGERVHELIHRSEEILHLLVPESLLATVQRAVEDAAATGKQVSIQGERPLAGACFEFTSATYSKEHGKKIRRIFYQLPDGVELSEDTTFEETEDPEAEVGAYAPAHKYELRCKGRVEGPVPGVLEVYRACREEGLIHQCAAKLLPAE